MKTIIVAGIPRSGTTVTMQMLHAGGYPCFGTPPAFENYRWGAIPWELTKGKAIKALDVGTPENTPPPGEYFVIMLTRNHKQQAKSIIKFSRVVCMLEIGRAAARKMESDLPKQYAQMERWCRHQTNYLKISFEDIINHPQLIAKKIADFIEHPIDVEKMASVVVQRDTNCYDGMLETTFLNKL